jgi:hypothetical protein
MALSRKTELDLPGGMGKLPVEIGT